MASFLWVAGPGLTPAGATPSQAGGDDVATWQTGWSWTYATKFVVNDSTADVTLNETETYTVAAIVAKDGYSDAYQVNISGNINSCSGSAQGFSIGSCSGSASGTAWYEVGNLALIEEDQAQSISAKAEGLVSVSANFNISLASTPGLPITDFRLHDGDAWQVNSNIAENGTFSYNAGSFGSGSGPIDSNQPVTATASDASTTLSGTPVDQVTINDPNDGFTGTGDWAPSDNNLAFLDLNMTGSGIEITQTLSSHSTPSPSSSLTENLSAQTSCAGGAITVSGALNPQQSNIGVTVTTDLEPATPGDLASTSTTTGAGGAYSATITAPSASDNLAKPGIRGSYAVIVSAGSTKSAATLEVTTQDCTRTTYSGATSAAQGGSAGVSATVTDLATGQPVSGVPVTFSLSGQSATAMASTGSNGVATTTLSVLGPPRSGATLTASFTGTAADASSSATSAFNVTQDATATSLTASEPQATVGDPVTFTAHVATSGPSVAAAPTGTVTFTVDGIQLGTSPVALSGSGDATSVADSTMSINTHSIVATYSGDANYAGSSQTISFLVHKQLTGTTTTLSSSPNPSVFGQAVSLTATVTGADGGTPMGTVNFFDGGNLIASAPLDGSSADQAWVMVSNLTAGSHSLTAVYEGDDVTYNASPSAPTGQTVNQDGTLTTVASSDNPSVTGEGVTFNVTVAPVAPGAGTPSGTVQLSVNGVDLGSPIGLTGGVAIVNDPSPPTGSDTVMAAYSGDGNFTSGSGSLMQTVNQAATTTVLETSPNPSVTGQGVTFTATVSPVAPGAGNPTGTIAFSDGSQALGSATLSPTTNGDQATIELANLAQGDHTITATYGGDAGFTGSESSTVDQTVNEAPPIVGTSTSVSSSASPSVFGQAVSFVATVGAESGDTTPTGTVQFSMDGANLGGPVNIVDGVATSPSTSSLVAGAHTVIAAYSGDIGFSVSGEVFTQTVAQASTTVTGQSSADPAAFGQSVTFTATVSPVAPGAGVPGGIVQFSLDGTHFGAPVTVTGGAATSAAATGLAPGVHTVSFLASGDSNFAGSSGSFTFTVSKIPTTTTLVATPNPVTFGQPVSFIATVAHSTGPGTPTGTVTFSDGTTALMTVTATPDGSGDATATFTTSELAAGPHSITATYSGDNAFAGSGSDSTILTVGSAPTTLTVDPAILSLRIIPLPISIQLSLGVLSATLTSNGQPVAGQTVTFVANAGSHPVLCTGITNTHGVVSCSSGLTGLTETLLSGGIKAVYAGSPSYQAATGTAGLIRVQL